jgi:hypothetical protein
MCVRSSWLYHDFQYSHRPGKRIFGGLFIGLDSPVQGITGAPRLQLSNIAAVNVSADKESKYATSYA